MTGVQTCALPISTIIVKGVPPNAPDMEQAVLSAVIASRDAADIAIDLLNADAFYEERNKCLYNACKSLYTRSLPIDLLTVAEEIKRAVQAITDKFNIEEYSPAAAKEAELYSKYREYKDLASIIREKEAGNFLDGLLRGFRKDHYTEKARRMIDKIATLKPSEFQQFFDSIRVKDPKEFEDLVYLLKIQKRMDVFSFP